MATINPELTQPPAMTIPTFHYYDRPDGIKVYQFIQFSREAVDAWTEIGAQNELVAQAEGFALFNLYDFQAGLLPTPYFMSKGLQSFRKTPLDLPQYYAIVSRDSISTGLLQNAIRPFNQVRNMIQFFREEAPAIAWLQDRQAAHR